MRPARSWAANARPLRRRPAGPDVGRPGVTTRVDRCLRVLLRADTLCTTPRPYVHQLAAAEPPGRT
eukprot:14446123-Alexandrium_andersonii.AAC.1